MKWIIVGRWKGIRHHQRMIRVTPNEHQVNKVILLCGKVSSILKKKTLKLEKRETHQSNGNWSYWSFRDSVFLIFAYLVKGVKLFSLKNNVYQFTIWLKNNLWKFTNSLVSFTMFEVDVILIVEIRNTPPDTWNTFLLNIWSDLNHYSDWNIVRILIRQLFKICHLLPQILHEWYDVSYNHFRNK